MKKTRVALKWLVNFALFSLSVSLSFCAFADAEQAVKRKTTITDAKGNKVQVIDFNDAVIEGKAMAPDGFLLQSRKPGSYKTIIELRKNFRSHVNNSMYEGLLISPINSQ